MSSQASHVAGATELTGFSLFNRLPPELRIMIWEEFVRIRRFIPLNPLLWEPYGQELRFFEKPDEQKFKRYEQPWEKEHKLYGIPLALVPPLLLVNRESRDVAMKSLLICIVRWHFTLKTVVDRKDKYIALGSHDILVDPNGFRMYPGPITGRDGFLSIFV